MKYIILDLEWNQPLSYQSAVYREVGDRLMFEMLQIGAVKMSEDLQFEDSISIPIQPTHYVKVHPRIRRMTGLDDELLQEAPFFREAMEQFVAWCGEDYTLLTWGCDDVSVLHQNLEFFDVHPQLPPLCDIQKMFSVEHQLKDRMGLKAAMTMMNIEPEEDKAFHNALNDAYYTGLVFATFEHPKDALKYPQQPKLLVHTDPATHKRIRGAQRFATLKEAMESPQIRTVKCPTCGKPAVLEGEYIPQSADKYMGLAKCSAHGMVLCRMKLYVDAEKKIAMTFTVSRATASTVAYLHTKALQIAQRKANGGLPDAEQALRHATTSSVPFDE